MRGRAARALKTLFAGALAACGARPAKVSSAQILRWAATLDLSAGDTTVELPRDLASASHDHRAQVAALDGGRRCVLLKQRVFGKDNFEGLLVCDQPLRATELATAGAPARPYVTLAGHGVFEELYVRRRIDDRTVEVFFDLE